ncbi:MAG TPA: hypothetical protein VLS45_05455 [Methylomicrobium sp.]|nr:hypothetical protein [Methylomicrobium sp.]
MEENTIDLIARVAEQAAREYGVDKHGLTDSVTRAVSVMCVPEDYKLSEEKAISIAMTIASAQAIESAREYNDIVGHPGARRVISNQQAGEMIRRQW